DRRVTSQGLRVMDVDIEKNIILLKGTVPGYRNAYVVINRSKKRAFRPLQEERKTVVHKVNPMKQSKAKATGKGK
ncbi:MAG: hypothetical protein HZA29_01370, partial [Candidatus Omnitrophica bacterium]|nr:hypothetical protein [Candidatus Omnitrophota bacterium]